MKTLVQTLALFFALLLFSCASRAQDAACAQFDALVARTYDFDEARLTDDQKRAKEKELDLFWTRVRAEKAKFLPCLRARVADPKSNAFFRFDGSNLLVTLDPSIESKRAQVAVYLDTPLDIIGVGRWVSILTLRGTEGLDVSRAAKRALDEDLPYFTQPGHEMSGYDAALFLWASQDEERATPQLFALANDPAYPQREAALAFLLQQATPQATALTAKIERAGLSEGALDALESYAEAGEAIEPRAKPKGSRAAYLRAFERVLQGDPADFNALADKYPDGERDLVALLTPADLPLLRRVRRQFLLSTGDSSLSFYRDFTSVIFAVMKKSAPA